MGFLGKKVIELQDGKKISVDCYFDDNHEEKIIFSPLSLAPKYKSSELAVFKWAVYDEFTSITQDYLKDEDTLLLEMLSTQMRLRDFKVILIGNNCDPFNPIFNYYSINIDYEKEFQPIYSGLGRKIGILHLVKTNSKFVDAYRNSTIGILTEGSKYDDYALGNRSFLGTDVLIKSNEPKMTQIFHLLYQDKHLFVHKGESGLYHLSEKGNKNTMTFTNDIRQVNLENKVVFSDEVMFMLKPAIKQGLIVAESQLVLSRLYDWMGII